jgi:hypothetical protein
LVDPIIAPGVIPVPNWYLSSHGHHDDDHRDLDTVTKQPRRNPHLQPRKDAPLTGGSVDIRLQFTVDLAGAPRLMSTDTRELVQ